MSKRLYIGKKDQGEMWEDIGTWVDERIPPPPPGLSCECNTGCCHRDDEDTECERTATTYVYYIKGDHVCYVYVCTECCEINVCEPEDDYPTTEGGYAVTPTRCINEQED